MPKQNTEKIKAFKYLHALQVAVAGNSHIGGTSTHIWSTAKVQHGLHTPMTLFPHDDPNYS